ncbi:hypothetical protein [Actinoallomurus iriomotensis]|uniref:Uncharacterized protein n=1 Tax=Actinoallomurus iriomotensis TaxID=478107 RepID=A0A9W6VYB7_9ACTN|nr:hypothetical protein [Actinoallomurus iriomotensis]GLY82686.1 hypothetical protein Airi02_006170 [Actinoallomurus iriomotensis]
MGQRTDRRHSLIVFRAANRRTGRPGDIAAGARTSLESSGFTDFRITDARVGGREGALLECALHDAGRVWAVREYFVAVDGVHFCLGLGSSVPEEDAALFGEIAARFEILP